MESVAIAGHQGDLAHQVPWVNQVQMAHREFLAYLERVGLQD